MLNGKAGLLQVSGSGKTLEVDKLRLPGESVSDPSQRCIVDIVGEKPIEATSEGRPDGLDLAVTATNLTDAREQGRVFAYGDFITVVINFLIVAIALFTVIKGINTLKREPPPARPPSAGPEVELLTQRAAFAALSEGDAFLAGRIKCCRRSRDRFA